MRLLILNWRCPTNPRAGGAEFLTFEIAKRLAAAGNTVEWFSAAFPGSKAREDLDGVRIVRAGRQWTVHLQAFRHYFGNLRQRFDVVIDEVNTIPFFTPLWADIPVVMFIHQLAREVWWYESPFPVSAAGFLVEPLYLRCYSRTPILTVSPSTETDLVKIGLNGPITIIPEGLEPVIVRAAPRETIPTFLYVSRISPSKRITHIVEAFRAFREAIGFGQLWLVGDGPERYVRRVRRLVDRLALDSDVHFLGRISTVDKHRRMASAHALLLASAREGWGMVVIESNACGTPALVYDVPGLRDAVRHEQTGLISVSTPTGLASQMVRIWDDPELHQRLSEEALRWSSTFSFEKSAQAFLGALTQHLDKRGVDQEKAKAGATR